MKSRTEVEDVSGARPPIRVLMASLFQEGHSFTPLKTDRESFTVHRGEAMLAAARGSESILAGAVRALEDQGASVVPSLSAAAPPGGPVRDGVYRQFKAELLGLAGTADVDAVFLALHGAMLTESLDDPEGDLLEDLKAAMARDVPMAVALDLHAHPTPKMLNHTAICLACKENPHSDFAEAGAKAARLLLDVVAGRSAPVTAAIWLPLIIGAQMETATGPLRELHDLGKRLQHRDSKILDISIYNTTAYLDAAGAGQCVAVTTDADRPLAERTAEALAEALWARRDAFTSQRPSLDSLLLAHFDQAESGPPLVIGDQGDRVLAGAPGDDPAILAHVAKTWPKLKLLAPITDPDAVRKAQVAGIGGSFDGCLGGRYSPGVVPYEAVWRVRHLGDGKYTQKGPFLAGETADLGATAVLVSGNVTVLVTSRPGLTQDVNAFAANDLDPALFDVVVTKSGFHFKLAFKDVGTCVVADTPGMTNYRPGLFDYRRRRPVFPEDLIEDPRLAVRTFSPLSQTISGTAP